MESGLICCLAFTGSNIHHKENTYSRGWRNVDMQQCGCTKQCMDYAPSFCIYNKTYPKYSKHKHHWSSDHKFMVRITSKYSVIFSDLHYLKKERKKSFITRYRMHMYISWYSDFDMACKHFIHLEQHASKMFLYAYFTPVEEDQIEIETWLKSTGWQFHFINPLYVLSVLGKSHIYIYIYVYICGFCIGLTTLTSCRL